MTIPPFKRNFLQHSLAVNHWIRRNGAEGTVDAISYRLELRLRGRTVKFQPQFVILNHDGSVGFSPELSSRVLGFVGWLPYFNKAWSAAQDKKHFRRLAVENGLTVPQELNAGTTAQWPFLLKERQSSLCKGLQGPFPAGRTVAVNDGSFAERFVFGQMVKAWYWNENPIVVEIVDMPFVVGTGRYTTLELLEEKVRRREIDLDVVQSLGQLQGIDPYDVLPSGKKVVVDYRYMSPLNPGFVEDYNKLQDIRGSVLENTLQQAGSLVAATVPSHMRDSGTMFSVDGIVDSDGKLWLLEANCNPQLHPAVYEPMLDALLLGA